MTVIELIEQLTALPDDAKVYVEVPEVDVLSIESVESEEDDGVTQVYLIVGV